MSQRCDDFYKDKDVLVWTGGETCDDLQGYYL